MDRLLLPATLIFLLATACRHPENNDDSFLLNPVIGSQYRYEVRYSEKVSQQPEATKHTAFTISFRKVSDSIYAFTFRFIAIDTSLLTYFDRMDSLRKRKPNKEEILHRTQYSLAYQEAISDVFLGRVDKKGQLLSLKGFDAIKEHISSKLKLDPRTVYTILHEVIGDPVVEKLLNMLFMCVAGKAVKIEDTWVRNIIDRTRSPLKHSHLITFTALRGDTALLHTQTAISAKTGPEGTLFESGKGSGEWKVDRKTGLPFEWNHQQETEYRTNYYTISRMISINGDLGR